MSEKLLIVFFCIALILLAGCVKERFIISQPKTEDFVDCYKSELQLGNSAWKECNEQMMKRNLLIKAVEEKE